MIYLISVSTRRNFWITVSADCLFTVRSTPCSFAPLIYITDPGSLTLRLPRRYDRKKALLKNRRARIVKRSQGLLTSLFAFFGISDSGCASYMVPALTGRSWLLGCGNTTSPCLPSPRKSGGFLLLLTCALLYSAAQPF